MPDTSDRGRARRLVDRGLRTTAVQTVCFSRVARGMRAAVYAVMPRLHSIAVETLDPQPLRDALVARLMLLCAVLWLVQHV